MTYFSVVAVLALVGLTKKCFGHYAILKILPLRSPSRNVLTHSKNIRNTQLCFVFLNFAFMCQNISACLKRNTSWLVIGSPSGEPMFSLCRKWGKFAGHCKVT